VKAELALAIDLAEQLSTVVETVETRLTFGRTVGPTLRRRLRTSVESILRLAERDVRIVDAMEQYREQEW
jgi:hypothetical protein